jgi:hypothetical protein
MPPKKKTVKRKRRKGTQPLQRQSQKQIVNIKIGDDKKKRRRRVKKQTKQAQAKQAITPLAGSLGNTLNMGVYSDLSRLNTLENLINRIIPKQISQPISKPIPASVPVSTQTTMLGEKPISQSELDFISELESILEKPTAPSPAEIEQEGRIRTPTTGLSALSLEEIERYSQKLKPDDYRQTILSRAKQREEAKQATISPESLDLLISEEIDEPILSKMKENPPLIEDLPPNLKGAVENLLKFQ